MESDVTSLGHEVLAHPPILPEREMGAYEALWIQKKASFKTIAELFRNHPSSLPSQLVSGDEIKEALAQVRGMIEGAQIGAFGVRIRGSIEYPARLADAEHPVEFLYFRGSWDLIEAPKRIAIIGSRKASEKGVARARRLAKLLTREGYTIISGLALGIDTAAHESAISEGGKTIAVIGTPITEYYPPENRELQDYIAQNHLLVSQIPIWRYGKQDYRANRLFFPERNATMSALSQGTVIIEATDTSGTMGQARAALHQGRKLFILDNCFHDETLKWPHRFLELGAIRVKEVDDIRAALE
jgi:DNA processing protein